MNVWTVSKLIVLKCVRLNTLFLLPDIMHWCWLHTVQFWDYSDNADLNPVTTNMTQSLSCNATTPPNITSQGPSCSTTSIILIATITAIITAIVTALLATVVFVLVQVSINKYKNRNLKIEVVSGAPSAGVGEEEEEEYEMMDRGKGGAAMNDPMYMEIEEGGTTLEITENKAYKGVFTVTSS